MHIAERMRDVHGETAFAQLARANELEREGRSIIHLEIGEPDFDTPRPIVDSAIDWLGNGATHYTPSAGIPELREAIAEEIRGTYSVDVGAGQVVVGPGAKMMLFSIIMSVVDPGDEVIVPNPAFPAYETAIEIARGKLVPVPLRESNEFRLRVEDLESRITPKTRMVVLNSPQNPTGGVLTADDLEAIAKLALKHDFLILSDEIYSDIFYGERPETMLRFDSVRDRLLLVHGFSKTFAMTGWRLGFAVLPDDLVETVVLFINSSVSCIAEFSQRAAVTAFGEQTKPAVRRMVGEFEKRRDLIVDGLNRIEGIRCLRPHGAFYVFPNVADLNVPEGVLAERLLEEAGVSALPGTAFGRFGEGYLRFSFANSFEKIGQALERIHQFVRKLDRVSA
jgi:aspartate/methionine/tyrosine aminotransferase